MKVIKVRKIGALPHPDIEVTTESRTGKTVVQVFEAREAGHLLAAMALLLSGANVLEPQVIYGADHPNASLRV